MPPGRRTVTEAKTAGFTARDPAWEARVRRSFARQAFMTHIGAELDWLAPGAIDIALPHRLDLTQQHGYFHGGATAAIADTAAGYAALSLFPAGFGPLTVEMKVNLLAPARGRRLVARGRVIRPGRTLTVCQCDVHAVEDDTPEIHVATGLFTLIAVEGLGD